MMLEATGGILADRGLSDRLDAASRRIQATSGTGRAAGWVAKVAPTRRPVA